MTLLFSLILVFVTPQSAPASIDGIVVRSGTGEPISAATVEFGPENGGDVRTVTTGTDGRFAFQNVKPGSYRLVALRGDGFLATAYGQRIPNGNARPVTLEAGQNLTGVRLTMTPTGSISGRVLDRDGEPMGRVQVQALRSSYVFGMQGPMIVQSTITNDLGEYRMFWLPPGQYYITAVPQNTQRRTATVLRTALDADTVYAMTSPPVITRRALPDGEVQEEVAVPVYFPGATDFGAASRIELGPGDNISNINMTVAASVRARHVRGRVVSGTNAQPVAGATVMLTPLRSGNPNVTIPAALANADGSFDVAGVLPGSYDLVASGRDVFEPDSLMGVVRVEVAANDVENIAVVATPGLDIPGKVVIEGPPPKEGGLQLVLRREPTFLPIPSQSAGAPTTNLLSVTSFVLRGVKAGDHQVTVAGMGSRSSKNAYVKSIRLGNTDLLNDGLHVYGPPEAPIEVVLSTNTASLSVQVVNEKQESVPNAYVALIPNAPNRRRTDLYKAEPADGSGRVRLEGIAPGDYTLFAWEDVEIGAWNDPEFVRNYENRGKPVQLHEGSQDSSQITVISISR